VRKAFWHPELPFVLGAEMYPDPLAHGRGISANVDRNVEHFSNDRPDKFSLGILDLVVQSPQHAPNRARMVVLNEGHPASNRFFKNLLIEALEEKTSVITENLRFKQQYIRDGERGNFHQ